MALSHFYSKVPARMAMYRKCDNFDTFAKSAEITKEYIAANLQKLCEYKPADDELELIMEDRLLPVYAAAFGKDGKTLVHSRFSFVSSDYTGERPGWLCHSLILNDGEKEQLLSAARFDMLNKHAFTFSLSDFNLTEKTARPIADFPEIPYPMAPSGETKAYAEKYDEASLKKALFAVLSAAASAAKYVYISLGEPFETLSEEALSFINHLMRVLPYGVKEKMSFITVYNDTLQTKNYKIRFVPSALADLCANRGYVVDFGKKTSHGIYEDDLAQLKEELDFLYGLFFDDENRRAFIEFYEHAAPPKENQAFNLRIFSDFLFLYRYISGKYDPAEVVPDDEAVLRMISIYEKHRETFAENHRKQIVSVLARYAQNRVVIPQGVFNRVGKIYPSEPEACKKAIMAVILDLLHTNIMREKLFAFISATYESESPESRGIISEDLSRVFYGGFLQREILAFYTKHFDGETEKTKEIILEKFLMTIRTAAVQKPILAFLNKYRPALSPALKAMAYHTFLEMLPENDALSRRIVPLFSKFLQDEDDESAALLIGRVNALIDEDEADKKGMLFEICLAGVRNNLPLGNALLRQTLSDETKARRLNVLCGAFLGTTLSTLGNALNILWETAPEMTSASEGFVYEKAIRLMEELAPKNDLFEFLDFDQKLKEIKLSCDSPRGGLFYTRLYEEALIPAIGSKLADAFHVSRNKMGLLAVYDYAAADPYLNALPGTKAIGEVIKALRHFQTEKYEDALETLFNIPLYMEQSRLVADTLRENLKDEGGEKDSLYREAALHAAYAYLETGKILLGGVFSKCLEKKRAADHFAKKTTAKSSVKDIKDADSAAAMHVFGVIVKLCVAVSSINCGKEIKEALYLNPDCELEKLFARVLKDATKKSAAIFAEIFDYARLGSFGVAGKLESVVHETDCHKAYKKIAKTLT